MNVKEITVTSKNQITLPAEYVREVGLARNRVLKAELKGNKIILTAEPALSQQMQKFWGRHAAKRALTDSELKDAIRSNVARKVR